MVCVCHGWLLSVTGGFCQSRAACASHGQPMSVTGSLCLSRAACVRHGQPVFVRYGQFVSVTGALCLSRAACVRHGWHVSITRRPMHVTGSLCLSRVASVRHGRLVSVMGGVINGLSCRTVFVGHIRPFSVGQSCVCQGLFVTVADNPCLFTSRTVNAVDSL